MNTRNALLRLLGLVGVLLIINACGEDDAPADHDGTAGGGGGPAAGAGGRGGDGTHAMAGTGMSNDEGGADTAGDQGSGGSAEDSGGATLGAAAGAGNALADAGMPGDAGTSSQAGAAGGPGSEGTLQVPAPEPSAPTRLSGAVTQCSPAGTRAVIEALARSGIETRDDVSDALVQEVVPPARGLRVWRSQASAMACDLANGGGLRGRDLDDMVGPIPLSSTDSLAFSWLLAAYVTEGKGAFGAELAAALMGDVEIEAHAELVYPTLVVTTFLREVMVPMLAAAEQAQESARALHAQAAILAGAGDPCAAIAEFLDDLPGAVQNAVGSLAEEEDSLWGKIVSVAAAGAGLVAYATTEAARGILRHLPGMDAVRAAAAAASAVADIRAMFTNWELSLTTDPGSVHKSVSSTNTGQFVLTVQAPEPGSDWPAPLRSCAELLDVPLPNFDTANGASVDWKKLSGFDDPISEHSKQSHVADQRATYTFETVTEPESIHLEGLCELTTSPRIRADLGLPGLERLGSTLAGLSGSPLAEAAIAAGSSAAATLLGPSKEGSAVVTYHAHVARIDHEGLLEQVHVSSSDGVGPNGTWTGTWATKMDSTSAICGAADESPATWEFSDGTADLSLSFHLSGGVMEYCTLDFTEMLSIQPDPVHGGCMLVTNGSYTSVMKPPDPGMPISQPGSRNESYTITLTPEY